MTFKLTKEIALISRTTYDSIHASFMIQNGINTIITEDARDWSKIADAWKKLRNKHNINVDDLIIIKPSKQHNEII